MFCSKCGAEIMEEAVICPKCGCLVGNNNIKTLTNKKSSDSSGLKTAAKVFMIIGCVFSGLYLITLAWTIPMTINYCNKIKNNEPIGTGFKVCSLLFVNLIAGILMLCFKD